MLSHRFKTYGDKKSSHVKGWCGSGQVRSPGDFDGLDAPESRFLSHRLVSQVTNKLANKKKKIGLSTSMDYRSNIIRLIILYRMIS
jgi:hypothetical protein